MAKFHTHLTENGVVVRCYHETKALLKTYSFWIGMTIGFPIEHFIWEKVWPFKLLASLVGL